MKNLVKHMFTKEDLAAIALAMSEAEKTTAGEIRVSIRQKRKWREKKRTHWLQGFRMPNTLSSSTEVPRLHSAPPS